MSKQPTPRILIAGSTRRVAILTNRLLDWETLEPRFGGGERYCLQLGNLLRSLHFEVNLYQVADEPFEREALGFRIIGLKRGPAYSEFDYGVCDDFYEVSQTYDHVIYLAPNLASGRIREDALLICHGIWFDHNLYESFFSFRTPEWFAHVERVFKNPARVVSVDLNSINVVRALWPELVERMVHLPNWVDSRSFNPPTTLRPEPLTVLFPRRSDRLRGSGMLGEILAQIPHQCRFQWIGRSNPEDDRRVELLAESDGRLSFLDASFEKMPDFYRRAEICVFPTIASEGTSLACLEAMASGCAVVATLVGGLPELIQSGVNGLITSPEPKDIALAINHLIENPRERLRLQRAAVKSSLGFSLEVWEKRWIGILEGQGWITSPTEDWIEKHRLEGTLNEQSFEKEMDAELMTVRIGELQVGVKTEGPDEQLTGMRVGFQAQLLEREREIQLLEAQLGESERRVDDRGRQMHAAHEHELEARDEEITWLKGEVENYQRISQGLASANRILNEELAEKDAHLQVLREAVQCVELELLGVRISRGWRLLNQFRKVRRGLRSIIGRSRLEPETSTRPAFLVDLREVERHSKLAPLLEEGRGRLSGLSVASANPVADGPPETRIDARPQIRLLPTPHESELRLILDEEPALQRPGRPDVVCFSVIDWEFRYQRPQQMMSQFAAHGHRVFYISLTRFTPPGSAPRISVKSIKENIFEVELCSVHQPSVYGEVIGGVNENELAASLEELRSMFSINEAVSYVMIASWTQIALMTRERWGWRVIYDCMDEWDHFPGIRPTIVEAEKQLVEKCDLLVVSSGCLGTKWSSQAEKLRLARNAVDYDFYRSRFGPSHLLADAKHPIVGYFGAIAGWFDVELVAFLADSRPDYTFVLLGEIFGVDVSNLLNRPNVRLLGQHPYELMPKFLYQFDACMIPFKINPITEATDPVKLYEYLSSGKPVVSVNLPELEPYREHVYIARDRHEFVALLDRAINDDDRGLMEGRRALARSNDWRNRYETIVEGLVERTRRVSVAIVTYNNLELTKLCLESVIMNTEYPNYEVIVVDNHSTDGTRAYLQFMADRFPHIRIVLNKVNEGFARANNQAIGLSTGEDLVLLNNDTIVPLGWLSRLVRHLRHKDVGLVGPVSNFVGNEARINVAYETWEEMESFAKQHTSSHDGQGADIHMLAMFCVAMRRDVYNDLGPLDEQFGVGMFEDDDYAHRARLKGYRVICVADVFVHHFGQASFKKLIESGEYDALFARNLAMFESKWNVKWTPCSNVPLDFRADYADRDPSDKISRKSLSADTD